MNAYFYLWQRCHLTLLDDSVDPRLEGNETFSVWLSTPRGSSLGPLQTATVTIYDSHLDSKVSLRIALSVFSFDMQYNMGTWANIDLGRS